MKILSVFIIIGSLFLFSCKKKNLEFEFSGQVTALNTGSAVGNVAIEVIAFSLGNNVESIQGHTTTDQSGNYTVSIKRDKYEKVIIKLTKTNYFTIEHIISFENLSTKETNEIDFKISPMSWTKLVIRNIYSHSSSDEFKIQKVSGRDDCETCCPNTTTFYYGLVDEVVYCPNDADTYMKYYYWLNGNEWSGVDSVYGIPFDTITRELIY